ncbi:unnamed protein product [Phytomonas sp. Hart1]|nr:unnamed protein product [Phytomonas sp. Hart1]|eukprot:CCW66200.1 unnamed protein product [Phytomonas sp. isolate Hart1]
MPHRRGGQRPRFVRTQHRRAAHRLAGGQIPHEIPIVEHLSHAVGEGKGHRQRQPLRHRHHHHRNCRHEILPDHPQGENRPVHEIIVKLLKKQDRKGADGH